MGGPLKLLRILIADDHEVVRRGLREMLESRSGWQVVGEAATGREAVEMVRQLTPHVVILDWTLPELNGLQVTRRIQGLLPKTEVLILTTHESARDLREAVAAGARSCLFKTDAARDVVEAVEALAQHQTFFTAKATDMILHEALEDAAPQEERALRRLTARERETLQLLAEGKTNKEVAAAMGINVKTAMTHRAHIQHKLGVDSVSDLVRYAIRHKIISG